MRARFVAGVGGTLTFKPAEGTPSSATVTLKRADSTDLPTPVVDVSVTPAQDGTLAYELAGAQCPPPLYSSFLSDPSLSPSRYQGYLYRADWRYVVNGKTYAADQLYEVRRRVTRPTLTSEELERRLPAPIEELSSDQFLAPSEVMEKALGDAWDDLLDDISARGFNPDQVMDVDRLRRPHRSRALANLGRTFGPNWRQWAIDRAEEYASDLDAALAAKDWYDTFEDGRQTVGEIPIRSVALTR